MEDKLPEFLSLQQEAANEKTMGDRLTEFAKISTELAQLIAKNPSTPPELLRKLANSKDATTRQNVAANPNTPSELLLNLGAEFPEQLLDNPIFSLLLLENPNLVNEMPIATLISILNLEKVPVFLLEQAVNRGGSNDTLSPVLDEVFGFDLDDVRVGMALAMNAQTPREILEKLLQNHGVQIAEAAQLHVNWAREMDKGWHQVATEGIQTIALAPQDTKYLEKLANMGLIPEFVIEQLARHGDRNIRCWVATNPNTPVNLLKQLVQDDNHGLVRARVATNPNTPVNLLEQLAQDDNDGLVRERVALNPNTPVNLLKQLAQDNEGHIRARVALNPNTPVNLLEQLAQDNEGFVRRAVVQNPNTPVNLSLEIMLKFYAKDSFNYIPSLCRLIILLHPQTPAKALTENSCSLVWLERYAIAQNLNTPLDTLKVLAKDANRIVGAAAKAHLQRRHQEP